MSSNRVDEESTIGIPLVPKYKYIDERGTSSRTDVVLGLPDLGRSLTSLVLI